MDILKEDKTFNKIETEELKPDDQNIKGMEDLLENSSIGKLAKEVSEELDIESMISGENGIEGLMNGQNMMNIFTSISKKIDDNKDNNMMEEAMNISK